MMYMGEHEKYDGIRIVKISDGTVIDHIRAGHALEVLQILGITGREDNVISLAMNISSSKIGRKDIVKLEHRSLDSQEVARIALVAPDATLNIIEQAAPVPSMSTTGVTVLGVAVFGIGLVGLTLAARRRLN